MHSHTQWNGNKPTNYWKQQLTSTLPSSWSCMNSRAQLTVAARTSSCSGCGRQIVAVRGAL